VHWTHYPLAIPITADFEGSICTGSVFFHDGVYYGFNATRRRDWTQHQSMATSQDGVFRFGLYEADAAAGELRKNGRKLKLQEQPFRVLLLLLQRPGAIVTREEVRQALWPADTFVDFDHGLNTAVNKLRDALDDTAANPRFIETLARRGYRFIAPVEVVGGEPAAAVPSAAETPSESSASRSSLLTHPDELPSASRGTVRLLFGLIQVRTTRAYIGRDRRTDCLHT
jgi:cholera toxin transcriptional activator